MHAGITTVSEGKRGCGWRKVGAMYLTSRGEAVGCGRLPIKCLSCECCGRGIKPSRGWTWVKPQALLHDARLCKTMRYCGTCQVEALLGGIIERAGLIWIGTSYYPTIADFNREADRMGTSRRIQAVPRGFRLEEDIVLLGHRYGILKKVPALGEEPEYDPAIFRVFKPQAIEVIVSGNEDDEVIESYLERGLTPVKIERMEPEQVEML